MQHSQLLLLCEKLSKSDWQLVLDFAASPAHNTRKEVAQLLAHIRHYSGKVKDTHLDKEKVWARLYNRPFEAATLRVLMHLAQELIQEALAYQHWKNKQNEVDLNLLAALRERKVAEKIISNELKNITQKSGNQLLKNKEFYHQLFDCTKAKHRRRFPRLIRSIECVFCGSKIATSLCRFIASQLYDARRGDRFFTRSFDLCEAERSLASDSYGRFILP
jgi:hypothetical protein